MKYGCLFLIAVWVVASVEYHEYLAPLRPDTSWWICIALGLGLAIVAGQFQGLYFSIKKLIVSSRPIESWKDGQLVGISGQLRPLQAGVESPISGRNVVLAEYEVRRISGSSDERTTVCDFRGFLMAPCGLNSKKGTIRVVGFPLLTKVREDIFSADEHRDRFAKFLVTAKLDEVPSNPLKALNEFMAVLADDDGAVQKNFVESRALFRPDKEDFYLDAIADDSADGQSPPAAGLTDERKFELIRRELSNSDYDFKEQAVPVGTEVTIFGTYLGKKRAIDIGSGISNLSHTLEYGNLENVTRRNFIRSIFGIIFWTVVVAGGNYAAIPEVKAFIQQSVFSRFQ